MTAQKAQSSHSAQHQRHVSENVYVEELEKLRSHVDYVLESQGDYTSQIIQVLFNFADYRVSFVKYHSFWDTLVLIFLNESKLI